MTTLALGNQTKALHPASRIALQAAGLLCIALAVLGAILPGLPTTVFVLAASWLFARSHPRWSAALRANRIFGPALRRFEETRAMPRRAKAYALASMWLGIGVSVALLASALAQILVLGAGLAGSAALLFWVRSC